LLGQGTFGKVVEAWDNVLNKKCAIKIIKAVQKYADAAKIEIKVLKRIKQLDPTNSK
jgi:dual-specificity kinase